MWKPCSLNFLYLIQIFTRVLVSTICRIFMTKSFDKVTGFFLVSCFVEEIEALLVLNAHIPWETCVIFMNCKNIVLKAPKMVFIWLVQYHAKYIRTRNMMFTDHSMIIKLYRKNSSHLWEKISWKFTKNSVFVLEIILLILLEITWSKIEHFQNGQKTCSSSFDVLGGGVNSY